MTSDRERAAQDLLNEPITPESLRGAEIVTEPRRVRTTLSARIDSALTHPLMVEAEHEGVTPSRMVEILITEALAARRRERGETVTVNLAELHRVIDALALRPAA